MRKPKNSLYAYLDAINILETGSDEDIVKARKEYWRKYKAEWRKQKRALEKEFTVSFTPEEVDTLADAARKHRRSKTQFIKLAVFAYLARTYIVPDVLEVRSIAQQVAMTFNEVQAALHDDVIPYAIGSLILEKIQELERTVLISLQHPLTLEQMIRRHLVANPEFKQILIQCIENS